MIQLEKIFCLAQDLMKKEQNALDDSNLSNLIKEFEHGLNTVIGDRGNKISGGQKQRISMPGHYIIIKI